MVALRARKRAVTLAGALAAALLLGACSDSDSDSTATPAATAASRAAPTSADPDIESTVVELVAAVRVAEEVRGALERAAGEPNWNSVERACEAYPTDGNDPALGLPNFVGLRARATHGALWPAEVVDVDEAGSSTCFLISAAKAIPPNERIDPSAPTTAEIAAQSLVAALRDLGDASPEALRTLVERRG